MTADYDLDEGDSLSEQCRDDNIGHHGYCDGIADDGLPCMCAYCLHPSARIYGRRSQDLPLT